MNPNMNANTNAGEPADFCPARACAADIIRIEARIEDAIRLRDDAHRERRLDLACQMEAVLGDLFLAADEARERLSQVEAVSAAGAIVQLLAAIRDTRVRDDHECERARTLEAKAIRHPEVCGLLDAQACGALSQTKPRRSVHARRRSCAADVARPV